MSDKPRVITEDRRFNRLEINQLRIHIYNLCVKIERNHDTEETVLAALKAADKYKI